MQAIERILRAGRTSASEFLADSRALAATEFAVIVPLMLVMFFGTVEFSSAVAIDRKVTLIARTLSDLTSQSAGTVTDTNLQNTFTASMSIISPYDRTLVNGTLVQIYIDANSVAKIQWSKSAIISSGATQATLTTPPPSLSAGTTVTSMIPSTLLLPSTYLIFSQVSYVYTPSVGYVLKSGISLSDVSYTRPRQATCIAYNGVPSSC
ncbi:TadE/TadG family type IV pilus assembly protein [Bradyrhizobium sp. BR 10289]|uniref:TadE/TadG family type IV pilus assembly protein n=1 Tax=Bradyrhizobium sp. BR 10289 TaxID=2749993 RepID=UPI001C65313F|nr:TadE/TadG family type IV pilus assembly protein [Bradyrhizobium sp. BR 10289]MBW7969269.1 pilus assembly protein [Bradyrhizobium sp. BR 10289]